MIVVGHFQLNCSILFYSLDWYLCADLWQTGYVKYFILANALSQEVEEKGGLVVNAVDLSLGLLDSS